MIHSYTVDVLLLQGTKSGLRSIASETNFSLLVKALPLFKTSVVYSVVLKLTVIFYHSR